MKPPRAPAEAQRADVLDEISRWKGRLKTPGEAAHEAKQLPQSKRAEMVACASAYGRYEDALKQRNLIDLDDQINLAVRILNNPEARALHAGRYSHLLVDEYQDINAAQNVLIAGLLHGHRNLWVVGDDDQAIHGWRGSDPAYILEFEKLSRRTPV